MKRFLAILLLAAIVLPATAEDKKVTVPELLRMIDYVREQPFSGAAEEIFPLLIQVAATSDMVYIDLSEDKTPWLTEVDEEWRKYLLGGYIAGNMEFQLINEIKRDSPYAGFMFARSIYRKIKAIRPDVVSETFEAGGL